MSGELVSTGVAAVLLGVSRQHVVDLCERGVLPFVRVGTHRRIDRRTLVRMIEPLTDTSTPGRGLSREEARSLWLHRAVLGRLVTDPERVLATVRENLAAWDGVHRGDGMTRRYLDTWAALVDDGVEAVAQVLVDPEERACELRKNSPFAGVLSDVERRRVLGAFNRHWPGRKPPVDDEAVRASV